MPRLAASYVLGYHGCDQAVAHQLVHNADFKPSQNDYDWLGPGIYFWEANPKRGLDFAQELKRMSRAGIENPTVVGAAIDLGQCLDLSSQDGIDDFRSAHEELVRVYPLAGWEIPKNSPDLPLRRLD